MHIVAALCHSKSLHDDNFVCDMPTGYAMYRSKSCSLYNARRTLWQAAGNAQITHPALQAEHADAAFFAVAVHQSTAQFHIGPARELLITQLLNGIVETHNLFLSCNPGMVQIRPWL